MLYDVIRKYTLTFALVRVAHRGPGPGPVEVERLAAVAVAACGVVLAVAHQRAPGAGGHALGRVPVALAPAAHGQVGHGVVVRAARGLQHGGGHVHRGRGGLVGLVALQLLVRVQHEQVRARLVAVERLVRVRSGLVVVVAGLLAGGGGRGAGARVGLRRRRRRLRGRREVQPVEYDLDVGGGHPVLEHGAVVEVARARPALERAERDAGRGRAGPVEPVRVRAQRLLLVGLGDDRAVRPAVHLAALARVELERLPRLAVVHALVDGHRVRFGRPRAELQVDVRQLVLLAQRQRERHVVGRRERGRRVHRLRGQRLRPPARRVVRVVRVGQMGGRVPAPGLRVVAHVARRRGRGPAGLAVPLGAAHAARAGRLHVAAVRGVDEVGHAPAGPAAVVARVRRVRVRDVGLLRAAAGRERGEQHGDGGGDGERVCGGHLTATTAALLLHGGDGTLSR